MRAGWALALLVWGVANPQQVRGEFLWEGLAPFVEPVPTGVPVQAPSAPASVVSGSPGKTTLPFEAPKGVSGNGMPQSILPAPNKS